MQNMQNPIAEGGERRLLQRIMAPERSLLAVSGDDFRLPYNLTDISEGGMAFLYLNDKPLSLSDCQMDIYLDEIQQIVQLPVTVVADRKLEESSRLRRRCCVRFGELTQTQRVQLKNFITNHAAASMSYY